MTNLSDYCLRYPQADIQSLYQTISRDARYGHYVRIPERICRCLDYFNIVFSRKTVGERLHSYYLFIGVVDDVLDAGRLAAGREILQQLANRLPSFDETTRQSSASLATEVLKCHISADVYPLVLTKLAALYEAVVRERQAETLAAYIEQRKAVGCLTAELSYLLIRPLLDGERAELCRFLQQVGAVGCLVDSMIDLRTDARQGLLSFSPTLRDQFRLTGQTVRAGLRLALKHPRLLDLFLEAIGDDLLDRSARSFKVRRATRVRTDYVADRR